jgi:hypothetical protein
MGRSIEKTRVKSAKNEQNCPKNSKNPEKLSFFA